MFDFLLIVLPQESCVSYSSEYDEQSEVSSCSKCLVLHQGTHRDLQRIPERKHRMSTYVERDQQVGVLNSTKALYVLIFCADSIADSLLARMASEKKFICTAARESLVLLGKGAFRKNKTKKLL